MKQCDVLELITKGDYCRLRHTSEVDFSFFEYEDAVKDFVTRENIGIFACAIECGYGLVNFQQPLRKPGINSGLPLGYWE